MALTKAQQIAWDKIRNHETLNPDEVYWQVFSPKVDWVSPDTGRIWYANKVYGTFNTATLKALEKKGLIKLHEIGGAYGSDTIEIL